MGNAMKLDSEQLALLSWLSHQHLDLPITGKSATGLEQYLNRDWRMAQKCEQQGKTRAFLAARKTKQTWWQSLMAKASFDQISMAFAADQENWQVSATRAKGEQDQIEIIWLPAKQANAKVAGMLKVVYLGQDAERKNAAFTLILNEQQQQSVQGRFQNGSCSMAISPEQAQMMLPNWRIFIEE